MSVDVMILTMFGWSSRWNYKVQMLEQNENSEMMGMAYLHHRNLTLKIFKIVFGGALVQGLNSYFNGTIFSIFHDTLVNGAILPLSDIIII